MRRQAYLAFLKGHGDNGAYWRVMSEGGVTRERLESFARAITLEPEDFPHCRDGLIHDFKEYLKVLKSVHAGTDLEVAANAARNSGLPDHCRGPLARPPPSPSPARTKMPPEDLVALPTILLATQGNTEERGIGSAACRVSAVCRYTNLARATTAIVAIEQLP